MTESNEFYMIKGLISEMPEADQNQVMGYYKQFMEIVERGGDYAKCAIGLVGAKLSKEIDG